MNFHDTTSTDSGCVMPIRDRPRQTEEPMSALEIEDQINQPDSGQDSPVMHKVKEYGPMIIKIILAALCVIGLYWFLLFVVFKYLHH